MSTCEPTETERVLLRQLEECKRERDALRSLADALEADARHGNLGGRAEDAWYAYVDSFAQAPVEAES